MDSFERNLEVELIAWTHIEPWLKTKVDNLMPLFGKSRAQREDAVIKIAQRTFGIDGICKLKSGEQITFEIKAERKHTGNLFLETWSNRTCGPMFSAGWMYTCCAKRLLYYFLDTGDLYSVEFADLWSWAFVRNRIFQFQEREQSRHPQRNVTVGRLVPVEALRAEVGFNHWRKTEDGFSQVGRYHPGPRLAIAT